MRAMTKVSRTIFLVSLAVIGFDGTKMIKAQATSVNVSNPAFTYTRVTLPNTQVNNYVNGSEAHFHYNAGLNVKLGPLVRPGLQNTCFWGDTPVLPGAVSLCDENIDSTSSPGEDVDSRWTVHADHYTITKSYSLGISGADNTYQFCYHAGDCNGIYFVQTARGGEYTASDEGAVALSVTLNEDKPPSGIIVSGGPNATTVQSNFTVNSERQGPVGYLIATTEIADSGLMLRTTPSPAGSSLLNAVTVNTLHTPSSAYGTLSADCGTTYTTRNSPVEQNCTVTLLRGSFVSASSATVCVGDWHEKISMPGSGFPEQAEVTAVGDVTPGKTQPITLKLAFPHPAGVPVYQGGGCGLKLVPGNGIQSIGDVGLRYNNTHAWQPSHSYAVHDTYTYQDSAAKSLTPYSAITYIVQKAYRAGPTYGSADVANSTVATSPILAPQSDKAGSVYSGNYPVYWIAGSKDESSYDYIDIDKNGQNGNLQLTINHPEPAPLLSARATAGVVTALDREGSLGYLNRYVPPSGAEIVVAGSSIPGLNGPVSGVVFDADSGGYSGTVTFRKSGVSGVDTGTKMTIQLTGMNNYVAVCGAEIVAVANATAAYPDTGGGSASGRPSGDGTLQVEANNCQWKPGEPVSNPNFYSQEFRALGTLANADTFSGNPLSPNAFSIEGRGMQSAYGLQINFGDTIDNFVGYGGSWLPHVGVAVLGESVDRGVVFRTAPINNGCVLCVGPTVPGGYTRAYKLWDLAYGSLQIVEVPKTGSTPGYERYGSYGGQWYFDRVPTTETRPAHDNSKSLATTSYVDRAVNLGQYATFTPASGATYGCLSACNSLRGMVTINGGTATTGSLLAVSWPATAAPYVCTATQNGGKTQFGIGNSVATTTGFSITADVSVAAATVRVNYSCQP